jgi:mevalonate kinase
VIESQAFGKWILAGEHAVLRGSPALVFPVTSRAMKLRYEDSSQSLTAEFRGEHGSELQLLFWGVFNRAVETLNLPRETVKGHVVIESSIPIGGGLGASAALCVNVTRWLSQLGHVKKNDLYEFARQLENMFHGESSGVDIAVALSGEGLYFERSGKRSPLKTNWKPQWYLSYSGKRGITAECVARVKKLWENDAGLAAKIDQDMREAVRIAEAALAGSGIAALSQLAASIRLAGSCFQRWGLAGGEMALHLESLMKAGAIAVKPTGSGDGGYALSLWDSTPPADLAKTLIPVI